MKNITSTVLALLVRTLGRATSRGIKISAEHGLTSGIMLDYIYENKSNGKYIIGKIADRIFLNNTSWRAIRQRKLNLKEDIKSAITENRARGSETVILDIAAGPAQYLIEVLSDIGEDKVCAICQDIDEKCLAAGRERAAEFGLKNIRFEKGDAFNREALKKVFPRPNIIVASGLYDWVMDDDLVKKSLEYCHGALCDDGEIIFTNQAGNNQINLVNRAFVDFNKEPLLMKTRAPRVLSGWARDAGFKEPAATRIDKWGFYSVSRIKK